MLPKNFPGRRKQRRKESEERNEYRKTLSTTQQLVALGLRPGESKKEVKRLSQI